MDGGSDWEGDVSFVYCVVWKNDEEGERLGGRTRSVQRAVTSAEVRVMQAEGSA